MHDALNIPPQLDRALAQTVLALLRAGTPAVGMPVAAPAPVPDAAPAFAGHGAGAGGADPGRAGRPADAPALDTRALDATLADIVAALRQQGAAPVDVLDAVEDAFAALLAAHEALPQRTIVRTLAEHARRTAERLLRA